MTPHFTLDEFVRSDTAVRLNIGNALPENLLAEARATLEMAERIRAHLGARPLIITSGYRSPELNRTLNSRDSSDHVRAAAIDFIVPSFGSPREVCDALAPVLDALGIGQLIYEFGRWTHASRAIPKRAVNRLLTIDRQGVRPGIVPAR